MVRVASVIALVAGVAGACAPVDDELEPNNKPDDATTVVLEDAPLDAVVLVDDDDYFTDDGGGSGVRWHLVESGGEKNARVLIPGLDELQCVTEGLREPPPPPRLFCNDDGSFDLDGVATVVVTQPPCGLCARGGATTYQIGVGFIPPQ